VAGRRSRAPGHHQERRLVSAHPLLSWSTHGGARVESCAAAPRLEFPYTHTLAKLVDLIPDTVPDQVSEAAGLTPYAIQEMYPDTFTDLDDSHASEAAALASTVVTWAALIIEPKA